MRITYDRESDAATIYLADEIGPGGAPRSVICDLEIPGGAVILLFSKEEMLVGVEVLGASRILPPHLMDGSDPPSSA
jgi:uncharacterized protein YuzE